MNKNEYLKRVRELYDKDKISAITHVVDIELVKRGEEK